MAKPAKKAALSVSNVATPHGDRKRRETAAKIASFEMEAIFTTIVMLVRQYLGEIPGWPDFDSGYLPDVIRALAIRGNALNGAVMVAHMDKGELSTEDLERRVYRG
jgi:hypothetical protein